jgi:dTDP-4-amino-4,6-dideoxygalactose transaminase
MKDLNIDVALIESAITSKTRAISVVNYAGVPCNYLELRKIAEAYRLRIIEDNAHGFGGITPNGRLGSFGDVATLSFHATKNIQCGEGGALIVNSRELVDRAYILQEKGTNRRAFIKGQVEKYQWFDKGGSYLLSEILAAQLIAQLEEYDFIQSSRVEAWNRYRTEFLATLESSDWSIPGVQNGNVGHMFYLLAPTGQRDSIQRHLSENGIESTFHYQSLHASEAGKEFGRAIGQFRVSDFASSNLIRLPLWVGICETELQVISKNLIGSNF